MILSLIHIYVYYERNVKMPFIIIIFPHDICHHLFDLRICARQPVMVPIDADYAVLVEALVFQFLKKLFQRLVHIADRIQVVPDDRTLFRTPQRQTAVFLLLFKRMMA